MAEQNGEDEAARRQLIERLRQSGLRLDREGRWWHEDEQVIHAGLAAALNRWLDRIEDGRYVVRLDAERYAYVEVEDAPYQVLTVELERTASGEGSRGAAMAGVSVHLQLSDGEEEELDYGSLRVGEAHALYCRVKEGRFAARFSRQAYYLIGELLEEGPDGFALRAAGQLWPIDDVD
jgi:uncharacterized protein